MSKKKRGNARVVSLEFLGELVRVGDDGGLGGGRGRVRLGRALGRGLHGVPDPVMGWSVTASSGRRTPVCRKCL